MSDVPRVDNMEHFIQLVLARWDRKMDTCEIARALQCQEWVIARTLRIGRERRLRGG